MSVKVARLSAFLAIAMLLANACTSKQFATRADSSASISTEDWSIDITVDGGFAGISQRFSVDGATQLLSAFNQENGSRVSRQVSRTELKELAPQLTARTIESSGFGGTTCADCIQYVLTLKKSGQQQIIHYSSITLPGSTDEILISRVVMIGTALLKSESSRP